MNVVLFNPKIPQNTGNIARTCVATGSALHLIEPLGFSIDDKHLKRAGLDYWADLKLVVHKNLKAFFDYSQGATYRFLTTKAKNCYADINYTEEDFIVFGPEDAGLPEQLIEKYYQDSFRIPMLGDTRSLNLSNSVAIVVYEALRQQNFKGLNKTGRLTGRQEEPLNL
ncbi:MAG: tRNA (uridine(34)/cytosine(34)/5-carboxymethylaminomethyluridine(34)-2'-O)-methyltransferase TrmL [Eubacteriales bacterium]|nr:tRNA (uridine(34)/cytosine(34)/5-carboxymethylaminomethyluridine(34)-2'-O)-methyltransferase TrmL [Eubacteriales bacterium]